MSTPVRRQLMPGVWLTALQTRKFKSSYWSALLLTPLGEDTAAMTALLPRVLNRGTARCPDRQRLAAALEELYGAVVSPVVVKLGEVQAAGFHGSFLDDPYALDGKPLSPRAAELLGDLLLRPATRNGRLKAAFVEGERENLLSEIRAQSNDKMRWAAQRLNQEMCQGETFAVDRLGSEAAVQRIRKPELDRHYRELLTRSRLELYYCGSTAPDRIAQYWEESLMDLPRSGRFELPETQWIAHPTQVRQVVQRQDVTQAKLAMGLRTNIRLDSADWPALMAANALLGGAPSSKLFQKVREEQSLCYYAMSVLDPHKALMSIHAGIAPEQAQRALDAILEQLAALQSGDFTAKELEAAKRHRCNQLRSALDTQAGLYGFYTDQSQSAMPMTIREQIALLEQVEAKDVVRAAGALELDTVYLLTGKEDAHAAL